MKPITALILVFAITILLSWLVYRSIKGKGVSLALNQNIAQTDISQLTPETLSKIKTACTAPTTKVWFEETYKTKCANFGY